MSEQTTGVGTLAPDEPGTPPPPVTKERSASLWSDARRDLLRNPVFVISGFFALVVMSMAFAPLIWTRKDPANCDINDSKLPPSADHWFGTGQTGCDYYAQAIYGAGPSLKISMIATLGIVIVGVLLGLAAGYFGGWIDAVVSRVVDMFYALPYLVGALVFLAVIRKSEILGDNQVPMIAAVLVVLGWPSVARITRGSVLAAKNQDFVHAAKSLGASHLRIMFRHILPNAIAPVIVVATILLGALVAVEATLTFLGAGLVPPAVSWGVMISAHQQWPLTDYPHLLFFPCSLLVITVLSFILMGDALRDALDPKLR